MKTRRLLCIILSLCLLFTAVPTVSAFASQEQIIRVGYSAEENNLISQMDSINAKGYGYEVFRKIEEVSNLKFEYVEVGSNIVDAVKNGEVDIGGFIIKTDQRQEEVVFSQIWYSKCYASLVTDNQNVFYNDYEEIDGKTVATYPDNLAQSKLERYCAYYDISVEYVYDSIDNYMDLDTDYHIAYSQHDGAQGKKNALNLGVYNLHLVTLPENQELLDKIDTIFYDVAASEGNFFLELEEKYLADNIELNHRSLTKNEIEKLQERPLEVVYVDNYRPLSYTNENGEAAGAMVDIMNLFAQQYGFEVNYEPYNITDPQGQHENYDIMLTAYGDLEHDIQFYDVTEPYYLMPIYAQVRRDVHENTGTNAEMIEKSPTIGTLKYQTLEYDKFLEMYPNNDIVFYDNLDEMLIDFRSGEIDSMISAEISTTYISLYLDDDEHVTVHTEQEIPLQIFINKEISEDYRPIFNVMLDGVSNEEYRNIVNNNSNVYYPDVTWADFLKSNWYYFALLVVFLGAAFLSYYSYQQKRKQRELARAYTSDQTTGFMTINKFVNEFDKILEKPDLGKYELISLDVDMFKTINTHYSIERGTAVIKGIANALRSAFEGTSALITRRTADQFLVLRRIGEGRRIESVYNEDILPAIRETIGDRYDISMSFGNVFIESGSENSSTLIGEADSARNSGKHKHETTFITFDDKMKKQYEDRINITFRMENAIKDKEFFVVYQPKINFGSLEVDGAEALVRWKTQDGKMIYPDSFIPIFEENGFIVSLDLYVLEEVCSFIRLNYRRIKIPRISVNLSCGTILSDGIVGKISDLISKYQISPEEIEFEITESAIEDDAEGFISKIKQLKKLGFFIAIDDFGAGVSSLNRLSGIEADILKLDKAFFDLKSHGERTVTVVQNTVAMAKQLNMAVVAEGVETFIQALWLMEINCDYAQGYYFEKPMEEQAFKQLLENNRTYELKP